MRIAIVTDIHEDADRLVNALKLLDSDGYDQLVCLGDITGYSKGFNYHRADAEKCIALLREKRALVVTGNHDLNTCKKLPSYYGSYGLDEHWYAMKPEHKKQKAYRKFWLYEDEITSCQSLESLSFLEQLPEWLILETDAGRILFSHFLSPDHCGITRSFPATYIGWGKHKAFMKDHQCRFAFVGHAHPSGIAVTGKLGWLNPSETFYRLPERDRIIISPALVTNQIASACLIFDSSKNEVKTIVIS
jgi:predicted phosphodiesterase